MDFREVREREMRRVRTAVICVLSLVTLLLLVLLLPEVVRAILCLFLLLAGFSLLLLLIVGFVFMAFSPLLLAGLAAKSGAEWIAERQAQSQELVRIAQEPSQSLLRAGEVPLAPQEALLRPSMASRDEDPQELLRATEE